MKISIITPCLNSEATIKYTLNSVVLQDYKNLEHIIVDGGSTDNTLKILKNYKFKKKIIITKKSKLYEAINIGIKKSSGEIITILNSDDIYNLKNTISTVAKIIKRNKNKKIFLSNVAYFKNNNFFNITRYYCSNNFKRWMLKYGIMPPHTGSYINRSIYVKNGLYDEKYKIAGDYDYFLKILYIKKNKFHKLNILNVRMKIGGVSTKNIISYFTSSLEILKALNKYNIKSSFYQSLLRIPSKIKQLYFFNSKKLNKNFELINSKYYKNLFKENFLLINNIKKLYNFNNYILAAFNLAFFGSYIKNCINNSEKFILWPDGIFIKKFNTNIKKIPGRDILKKIKLKNEIKIIKVFGFLSDNSKQFLKRKFNKKIVNIKLPFGDIKKITRKKYFIKKDEFIFITLPTPKQEQFAEHLIKNNKNYKIICIGGSIAMASGDEKIVPKKIYYLEFLWRLRYDTFRRLLRLLNTLIYSFCGLYLSNKFNNINFKIAK